MPMTSYPCPGCGQMQHESHGFGVNVLVGLCPSCAEERDALNLTQADYVAKRAELRRRQLDALS